MGVEYRAAIVVGLPYSDMGEFLDEKCQPQGDEEDDRDPRDVLEELDLAWVSPYYDANLSDCVIGYAVDESGDYCETELNLKELETDVAKYKALFKKTTGLDAKVYLMPYGW